jgi:hypothetical protein
MTGTFYAEPKELTKQSLPSDEFEGIFKNDSSKTFRFIGF